ncbi:hypothetical protein ZWY2020_003985 [Hordeum vulgare]|nr:hypothetical protein ZWY2020_003985 [Hordeum vulgare]
MLAFSSARWRCPVVLKASILLLAIPSSTSAGSGHPVPQPRHPLACRPHGSRALTYFKLVICLHTQAKLLMAPASKVMNHIIQDGGIATYAVYAAPCGAWCGGRQRKAETDGDDDDDDYDCAPAA